MPITNGIGHSASTPDKQQGLAAYLALHMRIVSAVFRRNITWTDGVYHFLDVTAGSGTNQDERVPGSPLVFLDTVRRAGMQYRAHFIELEKGNVAALRSVLRGYGVNGSVAVHEGDHRDLVPAILRSVPPKAYGLVYMDMNGWPNFDLFPPIAATHDKLDYMIRCPATSIKRARCSRADIKPDLQTIIARMPKQVCLIRAPLPGCKQQWTFLIFSNYSDLREWRKQRFFRIDTAEGQRILRELCLTRKEIEELLQPQLALEQAIEQRSGGLCEVCRKRPATERHHWRYAYPLLPDHLIDICHECHCLLEGEAQ